MFTVHCQSPSVAMPVIFANVDGLTASKASILSVMCKEQHCHFLCLQETHRSKDQARPNIPGISLVDECPHNKHDSSVFIRDGLKVNNISVCEEDNVELITVELRGVVVHSMYKPPPEAFRLTGIGKKKKASHRHRRFQQPYYTLGIHHNKQRRRICGAIGRLKQHVTHTQRETTEIIQQCNMEDGIQPGSHLCVRNLFCIPSCAHSIALYV